MTTFMSIFSGGGLSDMGAIAAEWRHVGGIEYDEAIAPWYGRNVGPVVCAKVQDVSPRQFDGVDAILASPPCQSYSAANVNGAETDGNRTAALAVCGFISTLRPRFVVIENVGAYRHSSAFKSITDTLAGCGYGVEWSICDAADYGVPQNRRRLILRAVRGGNVPPMHPTHSKGGTGGLKRWNGWYAAVEDLLPTCPESAFANWQKERLIASGTIIVGQQYARPSCVEDRSPQCRAPEEPVFTVTANGTEGRDLRAFVVAQGKFDDNANGGLVVRDEADPIFCVTSNSNQTGVRALFVGVNGECGELGRDVSAPSPTIASGHAAPKYRALLVEGDAAGDRCPTVREIEERSFTMKTAGGGRVHRAWLEQRRVVAMTPRCLARFMTLPDAYELPPKISLACKIIGNGVPCDMMTAVCRSFDTAVCDVGVTTARQAEWDF